MWNVLLVDDEPWVLEGLKSMIDWERSGFRICGEAANGADALRLIRELRPKLVVTDVRMPALGGLELIEQTNRLLPNPPKFIVLSGYDEFQYALSAMRQRAAAYLLKPVDDDEVTAALAKLGEQLLEEEAAEQCRTKQRLYAAERLINRLIREEGEPAMERQALMELGISPGAELRCMMVDTASSRSDLWTLLQEAGFGGDGIAPFRDGAERTGLLVSSGGGEERALGKADKRNVREIAFRVHTCLTESLGQPALVAVSGRGNGLNEMKQLYAQALEALKRNRDNAGGGVVFCDESTAPKPKPDRSVVLKHKFKLLTAQVEEGEPDPISNNAADAIRCCAEHGLDVEGAKSCAADLEMDLCKIIAELNGDPDELMNNLREKHGSLADMKDYRALERYVVGLCLETASALRLLKPKNDRNVMFQAIRYVDLEFRNKLQLRDMAKRFHMNAAYMGQLFKKHTGKTFNEYLNDKRIEEAKRLLACTPLKIGEVALKVGYPDADYFVLKFKKQTGVLPTAYKNGLESKRL
ncbi:response regulator [Paenibacillus thailandensis]|uniref:Response regulator n=1 Tax=Paenibacillus thailandensis TaxID=393250 RepID=A0ABW5QQS0_9BACL